MRDFPDEARHDAGYQLDKVQQGQRPDDFKPMPSIGKGVEELRVWDDAGTYRVSERLRKPMEGSLSFDLRLAAPIAKVGYGPVLFTRAVAASASAPNPDCPYVG